MKIQTCTDMLPLVKIWVVYLHYTIPEEKTQSVDDFCFGKTQIGARTLELLPNIVGRKKVLKWLIIFSI